MSNQTHRPATQLACLGLALGVVAFVAAPSRAAEPAQIPLSSRVAPPPAPNVMLTIDDSGSMLADFMPEGSFLVNGKSIVLGNDWIAAFPGDWRKLCQAGKTNACLPGDFPTGNYLSGVVTAIKDPDVYQMQYRSPDVNPIYYNPDIRYLPWLRPDGGGRMPDADPAAAPFDPVITDAKFNLTVNYTRPWSNSRPADGQIATVWFSKAGTKAASKRDFHPGLVYRLKAGADPTAKSNYTLYDINATDGTHAPAAPARGRTDCMVGQAYVKCTVAQERQNFANWFTYYRMRESLTKAAVTESLTPFKDKLRLAWGRINNRSAVPIDGSQRSYAIVETEAHGGPLRPLDANRLKTVLAGVQATMSWPSTPLRTALDAVGSYFDRSADPTGSPWLTDPSAGALVQEKLGCRRATSLLMSDGYYNDDYADAGDVDGADGPDHEAANPDRHTPTQYQAARPFIDAPHRLSNTLADVAMKRFVGDLETTLDNKVWPVTGDIAFWQHLTQFMVGLGVTGTLDSSTPARKTATLKAITDGALNWPDPNAGNPQKIDDMWHAAVDTGGDFYAVRNVTELTAALKDAFGRSDAREAKDAGVAISSPHVVAGSVKFVPTYKPVSWSGDVQAWALGLDGRESDALLWRASEHLPTHDKRNLYTWPGARPSVPFEWNWMGSANQALVGSEALTGYIRGYDEGTGEAGDFRRRDGKVLGDFVNSPPVLVKGLVDLGYTAFDASYAAYVAAKQARTDGVLFAGANDGMLHAFRASDGAEVYAYLPQAGLANLKKLAAKDYGIAGNSHRFFVDGPIVETDAYITAPGAAGPAWSNIVVGSMGAGGKAFFALHVPTSFGAALDSADLGADTVMWERSGATDADIGYLFAEVAVGKLKNGGWKAFVGNGVYSTKGHAVLLVVDLETGEIEKRLTVDSSGDTGLMGVSLIKDSTTQEVVGAYAGDLKGNLWRFDVDDSAELQVGYSGAPLFRATGAGGHRQPITMAPSMVLHPQAGRVVLFGTGRLVDEADVDSTASQTYYGVWDPAQVGASSIGGTSPFEGVGIDRTKLQVQVASTKAVDASGKYTDIQTNPVDWDSQLGWLMDLPFPRQRVIAASHVLAGRHVLFSTAVPATDGGTCSSGRGEGYNYLLDAANGTALTTPSFDTNGDGAIDGGDAVASGFATGGDGAHAIATTGGDDGDTGDSRCVEGFKEYLDCHAGKSCERVRLPCTSGTVTLKDRVWRQILNPPSPR
jgi:type IV pilus assembly protein PilY1